ncbi:hypothetical protein LX36DRAFT_725318 [Colletotrichum falcatum]|nr:hypothetical protein LX36DRAFT_725318 [Colletotrichum falcatum]
MAPIAKPKRRHARSTRKKPSKKNRAPLKFSLLPTEMRAMVVENMSAVGGRSLLRNFSITSRDSHALAQKELYREISIFYEIELCHLTRSLVENPTLRKFIRTVRLYPNYWTFHRHDAGRIVREWADAPMDESRLSQSDRQLLILLRSIRNHKPADNIQFIFGLFLFFVDEAKHLAVDIGHYWGLLDKFLAAGLALTSSSSANPSTAFLPALKVLDVSTKMYLQKPVQIVQARRFHPFEAITASTHLREFTFTGDMDKWSNLDAIDPGMRLPFTTVKLFASSCTASTLSKFLRHCPDLQCLNVVPQGWNSDVDTNECLNTILTKFCPQIRKLALRNGGRSRDFFRSSATNTITCLTEMANLKELHIEVDAFFIRGSDITTFRLPNRLPDQLETLFLDCSFALTHLPFSHARLTARSPEAVAYRQAIEKMIQDICKAREDRFPRLNTIFIGAKWVAPVQLTKNANKILSKTGACIKVMSSKDMQRMWNLSWDAMKV